MNCSVVSDCSVQFKDNKNRPLRLSKEGGIGVFQFSGFGYFFNQFFGLYAKKLWLFSFGAYCSLLIFCFQLSVGVCSSFLSFCFHVFENLNLTASNLPLFTLEVSGNRGPDNHGLTVISFFQACF